ncbi:MAG: hypothetical protein MZV70_21010 [Desulfobacterales bacterium]|nr:hypothetical protein [Desulfobacterales bacterium]
MREWLALFPRRGARAVRVRHAGGRAPAGFQGGQPQADRNRFVGRQAERPDAADPQPGRPARSSSRAKPAEAIAALHQALPTAREADRLFALAELSFLHAAKSGDRSYFLAAAVYAYAFLFPQDVRRIPDPFDPRLRTAVDLYNQGHRRGASPSRKTGRCLYRRDGA